MGGLCSFETPESRFITAKMAENEDQDKVTTKLLLLGTGNTGKTTFFRQFRLLNNDGFTIAEREGNRAPIEHQVVSGMCSLAWQCKQRHDEGTAEYQMSEHGYRTCVELYKEVQSDNKSTVLTLDSKTFEWVKELWSEPAIKNLFSAQDDRRRRIAPPVPETCEHFWNNIDRVGDVAYIPNDEDLILLRSPTSGANSYEYKFEGQPFLITDVGGQRSERKKWMNVFENVQSLLYVVSLSAYDEVLFEDASVNAMRDQLDQFESIINMEVFQNTTVILFLNKRDLLEQKLGAGRSIRLFFKEYEGDDSFDSSVSFIKSEFLARDQNSQRQIYVHITHATDNQNAQRVLHDVTQSMVQRSLIQTGLLKATA